VPREGLRHMSTWRLPRVGGQQGRKDICDVLHVAVQISAPPIGCPRPRERTPAFPTSPPPRARSTNARRRCGRGGRGYSRWSSRGLAPARRRDGLSVLVRGAGIYRILRCRLCTPYRHTRRQIAGGHRLAALFPVCREEKGALLLREEGRRGEWSTRHQNRKSSSWLWETTRTLPRISTW
jgi:hypothetical protein